MNCLHRIYLFTIVATRRKVRSSWLQLLKDRRVLDFASVDGTKNPADVYTKILPKKQFKARQAKAMGKLPGFIVRAGEPADGHLSDGSPAEGNGPCADPAQVVPKATICQPSAD